MGTTRSPEDRRQRAAELQALRDQRSAADQIKVLNTRFGVGKGAKKERARLSALIKKAEKLGQPELAASKVERERLEKQAKKRAREIKGEES